MWKQLSLHHPACLTSLFLRKLGITLAFAFAASRDLMEVEFEISLPISTSLSPEYRPRGGQSWKPCPFGITSFLFEDWSFPNVSRLFPRSYFTLLKETEPSDEDHSNWIRIERGSFKYLLGAERRRTAANQQDRIDYPRFSLFLIDKSTIYVAIVGSVENFSTKS